MKSDCELLQKFVGERSENAFAELVRRHVDIRLLSSAARGGALSRESGLFAREWEQAEAFIREGGVLGRD